MVTLLQSFIRDLLSNYREPEREGTRKGDFIGLSTRKYLSTLLSLTCIPIKEIAGILKVPYGTMRVWRTEPEYRKALQANVQQFSTYFVDGLLGYAERYSSQTRKGKDMEVIGIAHSPEGLMPFSDVTIYDEDVMKAIMSTIKRLVYTKARPKRFEENIIVNILPFILAIRKGHVIWTPKGGITLKPDSPLVVDSGFGYPSLLLAEITQTPEADKALVREMINQFLKEMRDVL